MNDPNDESLSVSPFSRVSVISLSTGGARVERVTGCRDEPHHFYKLERENMWQ